MRKFVFLALACLLVASPALAQGVKGNLEGKVIDDGGVALPGVTVVLTSTVQATSESTVTDTNGYFRFVRLTPGQYKAVFALSGYQRVEQENIQVNIADDVRLDVTLRSAFTEEVVVTSESPLVDTTATTIGVDLSSEFFMDLPTGRNYASVAQVAAGAGTDNSDGSNSGLTVYGSTGSENAYYIDGVNTTGVEFGLQGKTLNFEFIQEVQVKTGGYGAEHGRSTGGFVNVITKSGGNEFHGDAFGYYDSDSWQADLRKAALVGAGTGTFQRTGYTRSDYGADLGGFVVKDRLWFFAAYDYVDNDDTLATLEDFSAVVPAAPSQGAEFSRAQASDLYAGKLTWRLSGNHSVSGSIFGDPTTTDGVLPATADYSLAAASTNFLGVVDTGGDDYAFNYDGVFGENFVLSARYGSHEETYEQSGEGSQIPGLLDFTDPLDDGTITRGWETGGVPRYSGFGFYQNQAFGRDQFNLDASLFIDDLAGQHEWKVGVEYEEITVVNANWNGGSGQRIYRFDCDPTVRYCGEPGQESPYYYRHRIFLTSPDLDPEQLTTADIQAPLTIDTKADNYAAFLQDRWQMGPNFTVNLGIRYERQKLYNADGGVNADIDDNWAPRLGFVWDFMGNGKSKLFGHVGRFYETIPMDIVIRSFGGEISIFSYNLSDEPEDVALDPRVRSSRILGGGFSRVDPSTKGQYISEYVLGAEYEVVTDLSLGVKLIKRDLGRVIEDALAADGDYFIGNPGDGLMRQTYDIGYAYGYECPADSPDCHLHNIPSPKRTFQGIEFTAQKRFSNNFQFIASAVIGRLYGNYDGTFQASTGQLDPNLNSAYDYYDFSVNNNGYLSGDRRQQYKLDGVYRFDWGLAVGLSTYYRTGTPVTAFGYSTAYNNWEYFLSRRGAFGKTDSEYEADLHLGYPIRLGGNLELNLLLDVFNLFDRQGETGKNDRYTVDEAYQPLDWNTGLPNSPITPDSVDRPPTNASFNTSNRWQAPRSIRLGARFSF